MGSETALTLRTTVDLTDPTRPADPGSPEFEANATYMAREFSEALASITEAFDKMTAATKRIDAAFRCERDGDLSAWSRFGLDLEYRRHRCADAAEIREHLEREAWGVLVEKMGLRNVMSVAKRKEFDEQLQRGELPPVSEQTITGILLGLAGQAKDFARDAAREVFDILRPRGAWREKFATNDPFRVGRRVILSNRVERGYNGGFRANYHYQQELTAIDGIFHMLDGQGIMRENRGPLVKAIEECGNAGRGETSYFRFKCFKKGTLHLEFKNLELVKELNLLAAGERVLGEDVDE